MRDRLAVKCPGTLATQDLETEIFLHMLQSFSGTIEGMGMVSSDALTNMCAAEGDGMGHAAKYGWSAIYPASRNYVVQAVTMLR